MAYLSSDYTPNAASRQILDLAWSFVESVPYQVTARWLFYQLLQAGVYHDKKDYQAKYIPLMSRARHNCYGPWRPDSLADDKRRAIVRTGGSVSAAEWAREVVRDGVRCELDHFYQQQFYAELWFEAEAMVRQFEYYTHGVNLVPFSGAPSIDYKWRIAKNIETRAACYSKPVVVLYFGDLDDAGLTIPNSALADVRRWCGVDFEYVRGGLNHGDEVRFNIPENIDKPGAYQWEALSDTGARELLEGNMRKYIDFAIVDQFERDAERMQNEFQQFIAPFADRYQAASA